MKRLLPLILSLLLLLIPACTSGNTSASNDKHYASITISAAASLHDVLTTLTKQYEADHHIHIHINSASSGTLTKQIEEGAPADLFISASKKYMDQLEKKQLIATDSRKTLLSNQLVVIQPKDFNGFSITQVKDLTNPKIKHIAIGTPSLVPAGAYAKESLQREGLWKQLHSKYVNTKDVTQALGYVETGNVEAGFVYNSDAVTSDKVKISLSIPESDHKPILYPEAILKSSTHRKLAKDFMNFLSSNQAQKTFKHYGFTPIQKGDS